jgi:hypothetical protein
MSLVLHSTNPEQEGTMQDKPTWQSTVVGITLIGAVVAIFVVVFEKDGIDGALKAWAAIGTLVGVITGAVPTYFFGKSTAATMAESARSAHAELDQERRRRGNAEQRAQTLLGIDPTLINQAKAQRPDLFA